MYRQVGDQAQAILQNGGTKRALDIPKGKTNSFKRSYYFDCKIHQFIEKDSYF